MHQRKPATVAMTSSLGRRLAGAGATTNVRRDAAFTLIEMLVVISIIGVLMALVIPSIGAIRRCGNTLTCASNIRQLNMGYVNYMADHGGQLIPYKISTVWMKDVLAYHESGNLKANGSIDADTIRFCPEATVKFAAANAPYANPPGTPVNKQVWTYGGYAGGSYVMNGYLYNTQDGDGNYGGHVHPRLPDPRADTSYWFGTNLARTDPSRTPSFIDGQWVDLWPRNEEPFFAVTAGKINQDWRIGDPNSAGSLIRVNITRHGNSINMSMSDGHIERIPIKPGLAELKRLKWSMAWP